MLADESSPHPWGCFQAMPGSRRRTSVFPTPVGVFLVAVHAPAGIHRLPHTRGGVSPKARYKACFVGSSPHPWGCFRYVYQYHHQRRVFPTPVGVFLLIFRFPIISYCLPHTRGGVSYRCASCWQRRGSSPHPWGCFPTGGRPVTRTRVFPTPVGVFLSSCCAPPGQRGLPHTRGGVSQRQWMECGKMTSSPHPWGCFQAPHSPAHRQHVFPTPVGVFLHDDEPHALQARLPHTRGGVSAICATAVWCVKSSPHPWGCFQGAGRKCRKNLVFPTPVGVFPSAPPLPASEGRLPHTRGGVSPNDVIRVVAKESSPHPWGCFHRHGGP